MAAKKSTGASKEAEQLAVAADELMKAAELLRSQMATDDAPPAAKKASTKKSSTAKKPAAKSTSTKPKSTSTKAKSTAAKPKSTAAKPKKQPAKKEATAEEPTVDEPVEEIKEEPVEPAMPIEEPKEQPAPVVAEEPVEPKAEEEAPVEEPKEEPAAAEPVAEEPAPAAEEPAPRTELTIYCPKCGAQNTDTYKYCAKCGAQLEGSATIEQPKKEAAATKSEKPAKKINMAAVADKTETIITGKGKLPIFIIVNALFLVCTILLMVVSFNINSRTGTKVVGHSYNLFSYLGSAAEIKGFLAGTALDWAGGAYAMIGILMVIAMLVPLALIVKNLILLFVKKNRNVYKFDAVVVFAFMLFYITIINFYGANVPGGPMVAFIIAAIDLAFTIFADLLLNRKNGQKFPLFSIVVIALVVICELVVTSLPVFTSGVNSYYGAAAASKAGGFMFVTYLIAVLALIALVVMQLWKLPSIIDIIMPAVAAVCSLLTLIVAGAGMPKGYSIGGGFVFGTILTLLLAAAYLLFTLLPVLKKFKVQLNTVKPVAVAAAPAETAAPVESDEQPKAEEAQAEETATEPAEEPKAEEEPKADEDAQPVITCPDCGAQNSLSSKFCSKCGKNLKGK